MIWFTPAGTHITQFYPLSKRYKISISNSNKLRKVGLKEKKLVNDAPVIDKRKQLNSVIPNIIHSLDASHIYIWISSAKEAKFKPIITIHDCFGTHPNKIEEFSLMLKKEFILLYTQKIY